MSARPPLLVATCGLAFSGKSTVARRVAEPLAAELVSLDALNAERGFDGGSVIDDSEWERTSWMAVDRVAAVLGQGRSALVDDTFSHRFLRDRFRACAHKAGAQFAILFIDTPLAIIEARIAANALTRARPESSRRCSPIIGRASSSRVQKRRWSASQSRETSIAGSLRSWPRPRRTWHVGAG